MTVFLNLIIFLWMIRISANIFSFVYLWFIKEYRFDRMVVHIKSSGIKFLLFPSFRRPPFRPKAFALVVCCFAVLMSIYFLLPLSRLVNIITIDLISFPVVAAMVFIFTVPTAIYHELVYFRAKQKILAHKPMIVVGITGSIGKSTTKEFLATILKDRFQVLKTAGSQNAAIGVAETILRDLKPDHEIFVVDMAAYKRGEIAKIARLVNPQIGIVTAINEQHLDLFGTLEHTMEAKYELISHLTGSGIAIFNADNPFTRRMAEQAFREGREVWMYTKEGMKYSGASKIIEGKNIMASIDSLSLTIAAGIEKEALTVPISGVHQASTVLAGVAGSMACGMSLMDAVRNARRITAFRKTMERISGPNGSLFIDDTWNNNPEAASMAIRFLSLAKGKKFLVFQPMIELGGDTQRAHKEVGALAGKICDEIILTNRTFSQFFIEGATDGGFGHTVHIFSPNQAATFIGSHVQKGDMVLFKGKEAGKVLNALSSRA